MTILGLECSAVCASCAVTRDGTLLTEAFSAVKLTHSQTLLPMMEDMLRNAALTLADIDLFAVAAGPGSFTGLRIGMAAVKGIAQALGRPVAGVSTLEAMAYSWCGDGVVVPCMDARCAQVYTAAFRGGEQPQRLWEDAAIPIAELASRLEALGEPATLVGDGAALVMRTLGGAYGLRLAPEHRRMQRAVGVCLAAAHTAPVSAEALEPVYLRLPQAERELRARLAKEDGAKID